MRADEIKAFVQRHPELVFKKFVQGVNTTVSVFDVGCLRVGVSFDGGKYKHMSFSGSFFFGLVPRVARDDEIMSYVRDFFGDTEFSEASFGSIVRHFMDKRELELLGAPSELKGLAEA